MEDEDTSLIHVHILHRHIPMVVAILILVILTSISALTTFFYTKDVGNVNKFYITNTSGTRSELKYGTWPELSNSDFFAKAKEELLLQNANFIEVNLTEMKVKAYIEGTMEEEVPILSKGREGSWWETPAGFYKILTKEKRHFSSFGNVYMPWSMQFQGNFFIHGWPYYPDGEPVHEGYSGGCVRLSDKNAEDIYKLADIDMPVLIFKESFNGNKDAMEYYRDTLLQSNANYLIADLSNDFVFAENNSTEEHSIASITKLLTALISVEYINVEHEVFIEPDMIVKTSIPRLRNGEVSSVLDLLSLLLMESSNEAAIAVTQPLGYSRFVRLMNEKLNAIGMHNTHFVDTSGVLSGNISTPEDLFMLAKYLYYNRSFILHMTLGNEDRRAYGSSKYKKVEDFNSIQDLEGMVGGKMGISTAAKDSMLAVFEVRIENEIRPIAIIVLGSDDSKRDMKILYEYAKDNFSLNIKENEQR